MPVPFLFERPEAMPLPQPAAEAEPFWAALSQGRLALQKCADCGALAHPPRTMCRECQSMTFTWHEVSGQGTVYSYVVTHQAIHPALAGHTPFATVEVELTEGPRITSNLVDVAPDEIEIGMPVEVVFEPVTDEVTLALFRRVQQAG